MLFTSLEYLLFLPATLILYWTLPHRFRVPMLLIASYLFYMSWNSTLVLLIIAMTVFNYFLGDVLSRATSHKKLVFGIGIVANLACLSYFKYSNFFVNSANGLLHLVGAPTYSVTLNIILPLGISFFVFEFIHYLFDIYRGSKPLKSFALFGLFAAFFPTQIAGPIKRYDDFSAQMVEEKKLKLEYFDEGVPLIIIGLAKKILIANNLAILVDMMANTISSYGALELWIFSFAFSFQVYFDFSGYTDIARGSSILFGYRIPINFNLPFIAANTSDLWNRWHISLSHWLRDYLFRPLGGTKRNRLTVDRALILTMTLGGLWHGASWNFVIWGLYFGLCLAIHRNFKRLKPKMPALSG
ncbi:MAG: MBOAT family protein, partial [Leptolyngbya sp.]|nr:MBOAT family protein [Candidatus Melainabacteria bacterium]